MRKIREIKKDELSSYAEIVANAFPDIEANNKEKLEALVAQFKDTYEKNPLVSHRGVFENKEMLAGMLIYAYQMNWHGEILPMEGAGMVAVSLAHKKQQVAKDMLFNWLKSGHKRGLLWATLYPFRPDFYYQMGFGYGTSMQVYQIMPRQLPFSPLSERATFLGEKEKEACKKFYLRFAQKTHGMILKSDYEWETYFKRCKIIIFREAKDVTGFLSFHFKKENNNANIISVQDIIWETPKARQGLFNFLHSQKDQIAYIILPTYDADLFYLFSDIRHRSHELVCLIQHEVLRSGSGLMYRVLHPQRLLLKLQTEPALNLSVNFIIEDSVFPVKPFTIKWTMGKAEQAEEFAATLKININNFSSLLMGAISLKQLLNYSLAEVKGNTEGLNKLFNSPKPVCHTIF